MAPTEKIRVLLEQRKFDLRQSDLDEISALLVQVDLDEVQNVEGWVWESVALIVNDPAYTGDAVMPEIDED